MNRFVNPESPFMQMVTRITCSAWLNILWLVCCLPVFTAGASTTALYYVTLKMARNEEGSITRSFFSSFRSNFRQATRIWLILLAVGLVLALDGYVFYHMKFTNAFWSIAAAIYLVALAAYAIVLLYIFPLLARFENTTIAMFKNSIMIGMRFLLCTALMALIHAAMAFIVIYLFTPIVVFGEGLCAFLCSMLVVNILERCTVQQEPLADANPLTITGRE